MDDLTPTPDPVPCSYDEKLGLMIHRYDPGECRCRCGEKIIRKPKRKIRTKFGRPIKNKD